MKRSAASRARARAKRAARLTEPGRAEWKMPRTGRCAMCGNYGPLVRHHVCYEKHVREAGGDPWDLRNSMDLGRYCHCHANHHSRARVIRVSQIPDAAIDFMNELLGSARAALYVARYYEPDDPKREQK